jgi:hypothetical protein
MILLIPYASFLRKDKNKRNHIGESAPFFRTPKRKDFLNFNLKGGKGYTSISQHEEDSPRRRKEDTKSEGKGGGFLQR